MALIAADIDTPGIARFFFDLRTCPMGQNDESLIARTIERAFAQAVETTEAHQPHPA